MNIYSVSVRGYIKHVKYFTNQIKIRWQDSVIPVLTNWKRQGVAFIFWIYFLFLVAAFWALEPGTKTYVR